VALRPTLSSGLPLSGFSLSLITISKAFVKKCARFVGTVYDSCNNSIRKEFAVIGWIKMVLRGNYTGEHADIGESACVAKNAGADCVGIA
jgi:hypothetical protein